MCVCVVRDSYLPESTLAIITQTVSDRAPRVFNRRVEFLYNAPTTIISWMYVSSVYIQRRTQIGLRAHNTDLVRGTEIAYRLRDLGVRVSFGLGFHRICATTPLPIDMCECRMLSSSHVFTRTLATIFKGVTINHAERSCLARVILKTRNSHPFLSSCRLKP